MKTLIAFLILNVMSTSVLADSYFLTGLFTRDKIQSRLATHQQIQDSEFFAFRAGLGKENFRQFIEYTRIFLKRDIEVTLLSMNADYLHHYNEKLTFFAGGQLAFALAGVSDKHSNEGLGLGTRAGMKVKINDKTNLESGIQVTKTHGLDIETLGDKEDIQLLRGAYIAFEYKLD